MRISTVRKSTAVLYLVVAFLREPGIMRMAISESRQVYWGAGVALCLRRNIFSKWQVTSSILLSLGLVYISLTEGKS